MTASFATFQRSQCGAKVKRRRPAGARSKTMRPPGWLMWIAVALIAVTSL